MLKKLNSLRNHENGFTLIELLIVVIIIGILAAIALPIFLNQQKAAKDASVQSDVRNTVEQVAVYEVANSGHTYKVDATNNPGVTAAMVKIVVSSGNTVSVDANSDGSYEVWGYNANGAQYKASASAYDYQSLTGKFIGTGPSNGAAADQTVTG